MRWNIFRRGPNEIEVAKTGNNYYANVKVNGEMVMAVVQPPLSSNTNTSMEAGIKVYDADGNLKIDRSKLVKGGEPLVLFKEDNAAGLKLLNVFPTAKADIFEAIRQHPDIKINIDKLTEFNASSVQDNNRVVLGSSALQISKNTLSIIHSPEIRPDKKETIDMLLKFIIKSLFGEEQKYRSNIMLLDMTDNTLKVKAHCNMDGDPDRGFKIGSNAGGAGRALQRDAIEIVDLTRYDHAYYHIDSTKVWKDMRSLFSIPIHDSQHNIIGILNIDTNKNVNDTRFYDSYFQSYVGIATDIFGRLLMAGTNEE
jgi:hypothetical protein